MTKQKGNQTQKGGPSVSVYTQLQQYQGTKETERFICETLNYHQTDREEFSGGEDKFPYKKKTNNPPEIVEMERLPGPVKKIIQARKIRLNGKDQRQYLVRFKKHTAYKDKWLEEDAITVGNLHMSRFGASRRTKQSHQ
ncbi:hypothetical protein O181_085303 [Austropuccinia psidii MF-1]|uniref:Chromo domain-containing protein n=1 Tax=Austropuccinia psidii MF-1 TaxID=1389203 RepID=A0A9Q3ILE7_9BASI|nr:hypothetical protein [Austropuccinia psidii MF-1]